MAISRLCTTFRHIIINTQNNISRYCSSHASRVQSNVLYFASFSKHETSASYPKVHIQFIPKTLNIDFGNPNSTINKNINEIPISKIISSIEEPLIQQPIQHDLPLVDKSFELPSIENVTEKLAVRLIVIRRKKMKKHKRKKLRKRMKYVWAKIRHKRNVAREKAFQGELIAKIKAAEAFDAKTYVSEKLAYLEKERIPKTYRGEILPEAMIKQFLEEERKKKENKRNKPRLTLD